MREGFSGGDATRRRINERDRVTDAGTSDALSAPRTPLRLILYIVQISIFSSRKSQCILMCRAARSTALYSAIRLARTKLEDSSFAGPNKHLF